MLINKMEMRRGNNAFALKLRRSKPHTCLILRSCFSPSCYSYANTYCLPFWNIFGLRALNTSYLQVHLHTPDTPRKFLFSSQSQS